MQASTCIRTCVLQYIRKRIPTYTYTHMHMWACVCTHQCWAERYCDVWNLRAPNGQHSKDQRKHDERAQDRPCTYMHDNCQIYKHRFRNTQLVAWYFVQCVSLNTSIHMHIHRHRCTAYRTMLHLISACAIMTDHAAGLQISRSYWQILILHSTDAYILLTRCNRCLYTNTLRLYCSIKNLTT